MRHFIFAALFLFVATAPRAGETGSRAMSGWFNVSTPDGWTGRRYMDGNEIFAEEFDSNGDNRIDVWRFYRRGMLSSEERDLKGDGKVNFQSRWEPKDKRLISVMRDTRWRGVNDLEIEYTGRNRWEVREDRNQDGVTDRILIVNGPPDLFERLNMDLAYQTDVIDNLPMDYWHELWSDDTFTGTITDYRRYSRATLTHYGEWDGNKVAWRRVPADFVPPPPPPPAPAAPIADPNLVAVGPGPAAPAGDGLYTTEPTGSFLGEPYADPAYQPYDGGYGTGGYSEPYVQQDPSMLGQPPRIQDRTRYDGLPPGDSAARSLPARMRPPGVGRR